MFVILLGSRLRGNDRFCRVRPGVGWVDDCMDAGGRVLSGTSTERSETQHEAAIDRDKYPIPFFPA